MTFPGQNSEALNYFTVVNQNYVFDATNIIQQGFPNEVISFNFLLGSPGKDISIKVYGIADLLGDLGGFTGII